MEKEKPKVISIKIKNKTDIEKFRSIGTSLGDPLKVDLVRHLMNYYITNSSNYKWFRKKTEEETQYSERKRIRIDR